jgi:flagellar hook-length control protein FliK
MQTQALPIQVSSASASPAPARAAGAAKPDAAQFSQALSREMGQRQQGAAPAAASHQAQPKPQAATPAQAPAKAAATAQARPADGKATAGAARAEAAADDARDDAADAAAVSPVADMLALVASFNQPVAAAAAPVTDPAAAAAQAAGLVVGLGKQAGADAGIQTAAPIGEEQVSAEDSAQPSGAFALNMLPADAQPKADVAAKPARLAAGEAARGAGPREMPDALAGAAAQKAEPDSASGTAFKAMADKASLQAAPVQPEQLRTREADVAALKDLPAAAPLTAPAQQASAAIAQAVTAAPADRIAARVGTPGWDNQVGQKIVWMVAGKEQSASLTLNPPDMGPMQVVLNVTNDQATVTFTAAQPEVRQALENAMPRLREMMSESGIALGNATVNAGSPDQRQAQQGEQSRGGSGGGRFGGGGSETAIPATTVRQSRAGGEGLVDTFA